MWLQRPRRLGRDPLPVAAASRPISAGSSGSMAFAAAGGGLRRGGREESCGVARADAAGGRLAFSTAVNTAAGALEEGVAVAFSTGAALLSIGAATTAGVARGPPRSAKNAAPISTSAAPAIIGPRRFVAVGGATQPRVVVVARSAAAGAGGRATASPARTPARTTRPMRSIEIRAASEAYGASEVVEVLEAPIRILLEAAQHHRGEALRRLGAALGERRGRARGDLRADGRGALGLERRPPREQLLEHDAERPENRGSRSPRRRRASAAARPRPPRSRSDRGRS